MTTSVRILLMCSVSLLRWVVNVCRACGFTTATLVSDL